MLSILDLRCASAAANVGSLPCEHIARDRRLQSITREVMPGTSPGGGFSATAALNAGAPVDAPWLSSRRRERGAAQGPARRSWLRTQLTQLAPSVGHDPGMIKRQLQGRPMLHPLGSRGVVASFRACAHDARQEGHGTRMAAWIAPWIGVDADELEPARLDAGLLQQLAPAGVLDSLADVHEAARQGILAGVGWVLAADEQEPPLAIYGDAIHGQCRSSGQRHAITQASKNASDRSDTKVRASRARFTSSWWWLKFQPPSTPSSKVERLEANHSTVWTMSSRAPERRTGPILA